MKPLRKSLRLGAELFACQNLWRVLDGFLFFVRLGQATELLMGTPTELQLPQNPILVPPGAVKIFLSLLFYGIFAVILAKAHWGLNHDAGMSVDLWRHPPAPIQAKAPTNRGTRYRTR